MEKENTIDASNGSISPIEAINELIYTVRGVQVMLDRDLARLYQVETKVLNQAVKRNLRRFPDRFMFQLTELEMNRLVTNCDRLRPLKHSSFPATVYTRFTECVELDFVKHNEQCIPIKKVQLPLHVHDRFLIIDNQVYLLGASVKDMGKGLCAIASVGFSAEIVLGMVN